MSLYVSMCKPCDRLVTSPGCTQSLCPLTARIGFWLRKCFHGTTTGTAHALTNSMHQPANRAFCTASCVSWVGGTSSRNEPITDRPRFLFPPGVLYSKTWGQNMQKEIPWNVTVISTCQKDIGRRNTTYLSEPIHGIIKLRIGYVPLCQLRHQLLKLSFKQLRVWQQRFFVACTIAGAVSLHTRGAQRGSIWWFERRDCQPHDPDYLRGSGEQTQQAFHSQTREGRTPSMLVVQTTQR